FLARVNKVADPEEMLDCDDEHQGNDQRDGRDSSKCWRKAELKEAQDCQSDRPHSRAGEEKRYAVIGERRDECEHCARKHPTFDKWQSDPRKYDRWARAKARRSLLYLGGQRTQTDRNSAH